MTQREWRMCAQAIGIVEQGWYQLEHMLPDRVSQQKRAVTQALHALRDAMFWAEMAEAEEQRK